MIEFGFWLEDDNFEHPTFFVLPYPFVEDKEQEMDVSFPEGSYFDTDMTEYLYEIKMDMNQNETDNVKSFFEASFKNSADHLNWENVEYCFEPLKMRNNN